MRVLKSISLNSVAVLVIFIYQNAFVMQLNFTAWAFSLLASIALGPLLSFNNGCKKAASNCRALRMYRGF